MMDAEMLKNMPKCIPGFYLEPERDNFARSQRFATVKGIRMEVEEGADKPKMVRTERPADLMATAKGYATRATTNAKNHPAFNEKTTDDLPAWDALDRHVLRFYGYFQEAVTESNLENYRVRRVIVYYYLEDDTMHVSEPRMDNSGCPSGSLIRRHRIPSGEGSGYIKPEDILVGVDLVLYGKTIRITDCDAFTRGYAKDHNYSLADAQDVPQDNFCAIQERAKALEAVKPRTYEKIYREMMMGGGHINTNMQQFMENDRKVCRFYAVMDDTLTAQYERRPCTIFSFLADDTIEIREQYPLNCGRDNFPIFFKRGALEKAPGATVRGPMSPDQRGDVWKVEDLYVGLQAKFLSNTFLVYDADPYTRQYYKEVLGIELNPRIDVKLPEAEIPRPATPPYTGYGSWDDSMASVLNLIPKVPRRDFHKLMYNDRKSMRFTAMFNNAREEDVNRRFVVTLNLWDDTMAIHEPPQRNSGILSGSFLEKAVHLNQKTGRLFAPEDLLPGNIVQVLNHEFRMLDMDQATRTLLDSGGTAVPSANLTSVLEKVRENMRQQYPLVRDVFRRFDKDRNGVITLEEMKEALQKFAFHVTEDEVTCIMRHFDTRKDGQISYNEFCDAVLEQDYNDAKHVPIKTSMDDGYKERALSKTLQRSETEKVRRAAQEMSSIVYQHHGLQMKLIKEFASMTHMKLVNVEMVHAAFLRLGFSMDLEDVERAVAFFMGPNVDMGRIPYFVLLQNVASGYQDLCCAR